MAIFTDTPVAIESAAPYFWVNDLDGFQGRFDYGGAKWLTGFSQNGPGLVVGKSTDGGLSWTKYYQSDAWTAEVQTVLDSANGVLQFVGNQGGTVRAFTFNLSAFTWSAIVNSGIAMISAPMLGQRPDGSTRVFYRTTTNLDYVSLANNAFGSPATLVAGSTKTPRAPISDSSGVLYIPYRFGSELWLTTLDASDTPGTPGKVDDVLGGSYLLSNAVLLEGLNQIVLFQPFVDPLRIYVGTPISAPVWTAYVLHAATPGIFDGEGVAVKVGSTVKLFWSRSDFAGGTLEIMQAIWDGVSVGAAQVFWDVIGNRAPGAGAVAAANLSTDGMAGDFTSDLGIIVTTTINGGLDLSSVFLKIATGGSSYRNRFF